MQGMKWNKTEKPSEERIHVRYRRTADKALVKLLAHQDGFDPIRWFKRVFSRKSLSASASSSIRWDFLYPAGLALLAFLVTPRAIEDGDDQPFYQTLLLAIIALFAIVGSIALEKWKINYENRLSVQQGYPYLMITEDTRVTCHMVNNRHEFEGFVVFDPRITSFVHFISVTATEPRVYKIDLDYEHLEFEKAPRRDIWDSFLRGRQIGALYLDERNTRRVVSLHGSKDDISSKEADLGIFDERVFLD